MRFDDYNPAAEEEDVHSCDEQLQDVIDTLSMRGTDTGTGKEYPTAWTVRALAQFAGCSRRCAAYALDLLRGQGRIDARVQRGQWTYKLKD